MKKDAFYFPHFSNAMSDEKLVKVRRVFGMEGYGIYFALLETLRNNTDFKMSISSIEDYAFDWHISKEKVLSLVNDFDLFTIDNECFYSEKLMLYLQPYIEKSERARSAANKRWKAIKDANAYANVDANVDANALQIECGSECKESKVKESKREEIKESKVKEELELFSENEKAGKVKEFDYKTILLSKLKKEDFKTDSEKQYFEITKAFYDLIIETQKQLSISTAKIERSNGKWIDSIRLILTDDKHTLKDLQDVFKVVRDDAFWKGKVLSTSKLRIQMDKLLIESRKNGNKTSIRKPKEGCTYEELAQTLSNRFD